MGRRRHGGKAMNQKTPWPVPPLVDGDADIVWYAWVKELDQRDLDEIFKTSRSGDDTSTRLIYELCGIEVLMHLVKNLLSTPLYVSEAPITALKKRYIRRFYKPEQPEYGVKVLSAKLRVSTQFVRETLSEDEKEVQSKRSYPKKRNSNTPSRRNSIQGLDRSGEGSKIAASRPEVPI